MMIQGEMVGNGRLRTLRQERTCYSGEAQWCAKNAMSFLVVECLERGVHNLLKGYRTETMLQ